MLELHDIDAGYGDVPVLHSVSVVVPDASVVALLGPNGAGKTTLLRVASGLFQPWAGRMLVNGEDVTAARPHELAETGVCHIPEGRGIFPSLTVRENLVVHVRGSANEAIERAVNAFPRLGERLSQTAGTLSGGEQQMLALARAYASAPKVVLLDEVSLGLAPKIVDEIFTFLSRLAHEGASLLLVEQYVTRALEFAEYVYMLNRGRVVFAGEPAELDSEEVFARYLSRSGT